MVAIVTRVDDLHYSEESERHVQADETVSFGLDDAVYDIDLTAEHAAELRDFLKRYEAAATPRGSVPKPGKKVSNGGLNGTPLQNARKFRKGMRAFADSRPDLGAASYTTPGGSIFHSKRLIDAYAEYVAEHGEFSVPVPDES